MVEQSENTPKVEQEKVSHKQVKEKKVVGVMKTLPEMDTMKALDAVDLVF
jgi:hypothetical protein